ncbi:MAG: serine protein kinase PrkA [Acidobacteriota bacterium]
MENINEALENLNRNLDGRNYRSAIRFDEFLKILTERPQAVIRNVIQVFHDMIRSYVGEGKDEYPDDPESINFVYYDCSKLFVEGADHPFFADRLFANRLFNRIETLRHGTLQNKLYIFEGPAGCGKSTFLNNLLMKFEEYANTLAGRRYEVVWHLDRKLLGGRLDIENLPMVARLVRQLVAHDGQSTEPLVDEHQFSQAINEFVEVPCPSHDNPVLLIPKANRRAFFDDLFQNDKFKWTLFTEKEYEWVFRDNPCTICSSLYETLLARLGSPMKVFDMVCAREYRFNRRIGEGISVFNPGDKPVQQNVLSNPMLQGRINGVLQDSNAVRYLHSHHAKTNNGIYALMDIKSHNVERLIELHNIISEGVHKVEDIEENVKSLFLALMNPEDKANIKDIPSFSDRIEYVRVPYVLDLNTEVEIYRATFGRHIDSSFLPRALHNFARVVISTRLSPRSEALLDWIPDPRKYSLYCDDNLQLLKMEIYTGHIPPWLTEDDRKAFTAKRRRSIIAESEGEGEQGFSGRDSIKMFDQFFTTYSDDDKLINMSMLYQFFSSTLPREEQKEIPRGFLDSLLRMYDYTVLQEVKESLYSYNEEQISRDIQNYLFAVNFEPGRAEVCRFTGDRLEITSEFFEDLEQRLLGTDANERTRLSFRRDTQKEYTAKALTQEIMLEGKKITETQLFTALHERYIHNLKERVLEPFLDNENFRGAIRDYNTEGFRTYDTRTQEDVTFLMHNLCNKRHYTEHGAKEVCMYVIDNNLARKFAPR